MMRRLLNVVPGLALALGGFFALAGFACTNQDTTATKASDAAPDFTGKGDDGKTYTLASLTEGGKTLVLYFVKNGCGANPTAVPLFKKMSAAFLKSDKVNFVVVFNDEKPAFDEFKKEFGVEFRALLDPKHEIIHAYKAKHSQGSAIVRDGKILKHWQGFSRSSLTETGETMAAATGTKFDVDLSDAPATESFG